jgi:MerR family redox-sensitive transcriptional activator SoxR
MQISEAARRAGLSPSAIRYYERIGLLPPAARRGSDRDYGQDDLKRLAVLKFARETGFTIAQIKAFFGDFSGSASDRWQCAATRKIAELRAALDETATRLRRLESMTRCRCEAFEECGAHLSETACAR